MKTVLGTALVVSLVHGHICDRVIVPIDGLVS